MNADSGRASYTSAPGAAARMIRAAGPALAKGREPRPNVVLCGGGGAATGKSHPPPDSPTPAAEGGVRGIFFSPFPPLWREKPPFVVALLSPDSLAGGVPALSSPYGLPFGACRRFARVRGVRVDAAVPEAAIPCFYPPTISQR